MLELRLNDSTTQNNNGGDIGVVSLDAYAAGQLDEYAYVRALVNGPIQVLPSL